MKSLFNNQSSSKRSFIYLFGCVLLSLAGSSTLYGDDQGHVETWKIKEGSFILQVQSEVLREHGLQLTLLRASNAQNSDHSSSITIQVSAGSTVDVEVIGRQFLIVDADIQFDQSVHLHNQWLMRDLHQLLLTHSPTEELIEFALTGPAGGRNDGIVFQAANFRFDPSGRTLVIDSETLVLTHGLANKINRKSLGRTSLGSVLFRASLERYVNGELIAALDAPVSQSEDASVAGVIGPDVIAATLPQIRRMASNYSVICETCLEFPLPGDVTGCDTATAALCMTAFAIATTSCNIGDERAKWIQENEEHPVIAQNMYRLKTGRFEQIGMSWVKHGFFALSGDFCGECLDAPGLECEDTRLPCRFDADCPGSECVDFTGDELGVGCSDPYSTTLNGMQDGLGPRSHINAFTGAFTFPQSRPPYSFSDVLARRIQVLNDDLDPALNAGAQYFAEGQYVAADDALAGNGTNNVSFRPILITNVGVEDYRPSTSSSTRAEKAAIQAWRESDSSVVESIVQVPGEGQFILAAKSWQLNNGLWRYEYALQNINSDRSAGSFTVPLPVGHVLTSVGFHDVDTHSGDIFDSTDWFPTILAEKIVWATTPYIFDANANALRWGTLYNFRFDANVAPQPAPVTIGLFKPGDPAEVVVSTIGPANGLIDCNNNGSPDICDLDCSIPGCTEPCGFAIDCNGNSIPDDCEPDCNGNTIADSCDISSETSTDCNINLIPDECDIASETSEDCNTNDLPDECEVLPDTDQDGLVDCFDNCPTDGGPPNACVCPDIDRCCFPGNLCIQDFSRSECLSLGGTPDCEFSPCREGCILGDFDADGDIDLKDSLSLIECFSGPFTLFEYVQPSADCLLRFDFDEDLDVDNADVKEYTHILTGPVFP